MEAVLVVCVLGASLLPLFSCSPAGDPLADAQALSDQAAAALAHENFAEAETLYLEVMDRRKRTLGETHISIASDLYGLGRTLEALDRFPEAEESYKQGVELCRRAEGEKSLTMTDGLVLLGRYNISLDLYHRAEPPLREAVAIRRERLDTKRYPVAEALRYLGESLLGQEHFTAADTAFRQALIIMAADTSGHTAGFDEAAVLLGLGQALTELGNAEDALPHVEKGLALLRARNDAPPDMVAHAESHLGRTLSRLGRFEEAQSLLARAYVTLDATCGTNHTWTRQCAERLALMYTDWNKPDVVNHYLKLAGIRH